VPPRRRLDDELVRRQLAPSRTQAQADIDAGRVLVSGTLATKAARRVAPGEPIVLQGDGPKFVSRGGDKLDAALDRFAISVEGRRALDAGASTGGFTDCLLQRGATEVVAVDVGYGQLHEKLVADPRVRVLDRTNLRELDPATLGPPFDVVTADLSFISLGLVIDPLLVALAADGDLVVLVKPQFEAGREAVARGQGVVSDPAVWSDVLASVTSAIGERGASIMGAMPSPIKGHAGNVEFLLHVRPATADPAGGSARALDPAGGSWIGTVVAEASDPVERG
jgi:23S rRNA (cytidine1920-2'-O)/16S rRNA (cytidine1409-2'-O)-methyltransferase